MTTPRESLLATYDMGGYSAAADALRRGALRVAHEVSCVSHWGVFFASGEDMFYDPQCERDYFTAPRELPLQNILP
jgi:hypothetical protein